MYRSPAGFDAVEGAEVGFAGVGFPVVDGPVVADGFAVADGFGGVAVPVGSCVGLDSVGVGEGDGSDFF